MIKYYAVFSSKPIHEIKFFAIFIQFFSINGKTDKKLKKTLSKYQLPKKLPIKKYKKKAHILL